ncbi:hypothetical protein R5W24_003725 [Gemmata sp. JC717]|uniref:hypothetical protein n=1 Tax=Gemmata algarum TaxID=2975278 RepID=UPI0021BA7905|nr:hypothetical protein [Gemmata algarum]MDY3554599.1 hypothetical protein [Gemmata algarum]
MSPTRVGAQPQVASVEKVNLADKLALFSDHWRPKVVGELNGQHVKLVKFQGAFVWHRHDHEDELFLVVRGDAFAWSSGTEPSHSTRASS